MTYYIADGDDEQEATYCRYCRRGYFQPMYLNLTSWAYINYTTTQCLQQNPCNGTNMVLLEDNTDSSFSDNVCGCQAGTHKVNDQGGNDFECSASNNTQVLSMLILAAALISILIIFDPE